MNYMCGSCFMPQKIRVGRYGVLFNLVKTFNTENILKIGKCGYFNTVVVFHSKDCFDV